MTIEDIIRKFFFKMQMERRTGFTGPELYTYVCNEMRNYNHRYIEEQSVLRCLRKIKDRGTVDYEAVDPQGSEYILYPKRGLV